MSFNLFDYKSSLNPLGSALGNSNGETSPSSSLPAGGGMMPPTQSSTPLRSLSREEKASVSKSVLSSKGIDAEMVDRFIQFAKSQGKSREEIENAYSKGLANGVFNKKEEPATAPAKKGTVEKTMEKVNGLASSTSNPVFSTSIFEGTNPIYDPFNEPGKRGLIGNVADRVSGMSEGVSQVVPNVVNVGNKLNPFSSAEQDSAELSQNEKTLGITEEAKQTPGYAVGDVIGEVAVTLGMPEAKVTNYVASLSSKYSPEVVGAIAKQAIEKFPKLSTALGKFVNAVPQAAGFQAVAEGNVTPGTVASYAALSPASDVLKSLPGLRNFVGRSEILNAGENVVRDAEGRILSTYQKAKDAAVRVAGTGEAEKQITKTFSSVNSLGDVEMKTGEDVVMAMDKKIEELMGKQGSLLAKDSAKYPRNSGNVVSKSGDTKIVNNHLDNAMEDLTAPSTLSKLEGNEQARILDLNRKWNDGGLTRSEMNEVAGIYGRLFNAYTKKNTPLPSKAGYEVTRNGVKDLVRNLGVGNEASKALDKKVSDLIATRDAIQAKNTAYSDARSKLKVKFGEQVGRLMANFANTATNGFFRGIGKTFGGGGEVGESMLSSVEVAQMFAKDIAFLKKISKYVDEGKSAQEIDALISQSAEEMAKQAKERAKIANASQFKQYAKSQETSQNIARRKNVLIENRNAKIEAKRKAEEEALASQARAKEKVGAMITPKKTISIKDTLQREKNKAYEEAAKRDAEANAKRQAIIKKNVEGNKTPLLPAPRTPSSTSFPKNDVVSESYRDYNVGKKVIKKPTKKNVPKKRVKTDIKF